MFPTSAEEFLSGLGACCGRVYDAAACCPYAQSPSGPSLYSSGKGNHTAVSHGYLCSDVEVCVDE